MTQEQADSETIPQSNLDGLRTSPGGQELDKKYSWEELQDIIRERIEKTQFIPKDKFQPSIFKKWFMEREKVGMCFDWRMVARAYMIWRDIQKEKDHFTVIIGPEGSGKTTMEAQLGATVSPSMSLNDLCFTMHTYISKLKDIAKDYKKNKADLNDKSVGIDEGGISLFSREAMSQSNKVLAKTFMVQRFLNINTIICIPHYWSLDPFIRNHRINTLIIIKERGKYKAIVGKGIKILNRIGKKDKEKDILAIPVPYGYFWEGTFKKDFPNTISKEEYEKYKFKHIRSFLDEVELDSQAIKLIKVTKIEKEYGIESNLIIQDIQNGIIEGKKIGNQWFISQNAYKKLLNVGK